MPNQSRAACGWSPASLASSTADVEGQHVVSVAAEPQQEPTEVIVRVRIDLPDLDLQSVMRNDRPAMQLDLSARYFPVARGLRFLEEVSRVVA